jgi:opacity protein-like surface antigen
MLLLSAIYTQAQDKTVTDLKTESEKKIAKDPNDTIPKIWKKGGLINLNLSQTSLSNWAAGGDQFSLSLNAMVNLFAFYKKDKSSWDNTFDFETGYLRTTSLGGGKNDDKVDILSKYDYSIGSNWNVGALFNFRSQLFKGYTYDNNQKRFSSDLLSPAYFTLSAGFDYKPDEHFSVFISPVTARLTVVKNDSISLKGLYGVDSGEHHKFEFGAFLSAIYIKDLNKIISYNARLDLFSNYAHNPQNIDVLMSNVFAAKLSKWLTATWSLDLVYDDDVKLFGPNGHSPALQVKSLVGLGILLKL